MSINPSGFRKLIGQKPFTLLAIGFVILIAGCSSSSTRERTVTVRRPPGIEQYADGAEAYATGDTEKAYASLNEAVRINPNLAMPRFILGDLYRKDQQYEKAAEQYEVLTRIDPYTASNFFNLGMSYQFLNRLEEAAANYLHALQLNPTDAKTNMSLGLVHLALGRNEDALRFIQQATVLDPKSAIAWANLGVALDAMGKYPEAEAAYRKSIDLDTTQISTLINLGSNLVTQGNARGAMDVLEQALKTSDTPMAHKRYGDALVLAKRYNDAEKQYRTALRLDGRYYPAMNELGRLMIEQYREGLQLDDDKRRDATDFWRKSLQIEPQQPNIAALIKQWEQPGV